jgi:hypothetical protein
MHNVSYPRRHNKLLTMSIPESTCTEAFHPVPNSGKGARRKEIRWSGVGRGVSPKGVEKGT